jgi:hypothetical protein
MSRDPPNVVVNRKGLNAALRGILLRRLPAGLGRSVRRLGDPVFIELEAQAPVRATDRGERYGREHRGGAAMSGQRQGARRAPPPL